jgi:hypothetical protein
MLDTKAVVRALAFASLLLASLPALAYRESTDPGRFDRLVRWDPRAGAGIVAETPGDLPGFAAESAGWAAFKAIHGASWTVHVDRRSGAPMLVEGPGLSWYDASGAPPRLADLERQARAFLAAHATLFKIDPAQLVLSSTGSGATDDERWVLLFERRVDGIPVEGQAVRFFVNHGRMVAFGADRWGALLHAPRAAISADLARQLLYDYMGILPHDGVVELESGTPVLVPAAAAGTEYGPYTGAAGAGTRFHLAYVFTLEVAGERGRWVGKVDAVDGEILALYDGIKYAQVKGGIFPISSDGHGDDGTEHVDFPMPFANLTVGGAPATANDMGLFSCVGSGAPATTALASTYVRINDACGAVNETTTCDSDLDLRSGPAGQTNCVVPQSGSAGDTHPARNSYYQVSRINERLRHWLPGNAWLNGQVEVDTNVNATCNASWGGTLNMYRAGGGCANTGELAGVLTHEWGHGLDQNDGGGFDDPTEAYADITALMATHQSCGGRGFDTSGANCSGYGDACLNCSGVRDDDYDQHASHAPATPQGFASPHCGGGDGPCGKEQHCEGYVSGEAMWDLAARDLRTAGLDAATAWQVAEKLWFKSRQGSGGNAYNCALPSSDGCNSGSWFNDLRNADDDDGNLANGTPHAAAIFAAFARHNIACGAAADPSNQSTSSCPALTTPVATAVADSNAIDLSWTAVPNASNTLILRNDLGCGFPFNVVATVASPATTYVDDNLPNGFTVYYSVQAQGSNASCESALASCQSVTALPHRGEIILDKGRYSCSDTLQIKLRDLDLNQNSSVVETVRVTVSSSSETTPETVTLTESGPATAQFTGTLTTSGGAVINGDGVLQVANGDVVTVTYHDANDGTGHAAVILKDTTADCSGPSISNVRVTGLTDASGVVQWDTNEPGTSRVEWGSTPALGTVATDATLATTHAITLSPIAECGKIYFRVSSTDAQGNATTRDAGGAPFAANAEIIPGFYRDTFEASTGWTLEGEWQIQAPQGLGHADPGSAFEGTKVLGQDLSGLGNHLGDYEVTTTQRAATPVINATALTGGQLKFRRWLNTSGSAVSTVEVKKNGTWNTVWTSPTFFGVTESAWTLQTIDISTFADGNSQLQVSFKQTGGTNAANLKGGWNVDRFIIKSASQPDFAACGGCGAAPSFAGATGASDLNACGDTGVQVNWQAAASWGTGSGGTYSVYRDTSPSFTPSPATRIATGVSGTSYNDTAAPNGTALFYIVQAENDETCSNGPKNGGVVDGNTVRVSARDDLSQPPPGDLGGSLRLGKVNDAHVRLSWAASANTASYRVYRADGPSGTFVKVADVAGTVYEDKDELVNPANRTYVVKAVDACGNDGP